MVKVTNTLLPSAKLPLERIRGTERQRFKQAELLNKKLIEVLEPSTNGKHLNMLKFTNEIEKILAPDKILFYITKAPENFNGTIRRVLQYDKYTPEVRTSIPNYEITLPTNGKNQITNKYSAYHQAKHLFDFLFNPKIAKFRLKGEYNSFVTLFIENKKMEFEKLLFNFDKRQKKGEIIQQARKLTKEMPDEFAIDEFQSMRNVLKSEISTHKQDLAYLLKKPFQNRKAILNNIRIKLKMKESLNILNELLKNRIAQVRIKNKRQVAWQKALNSSSNN